MKLLICVLSVVVATMADEIEDFKQQLNNGNDLFTANMFSEVLKQQNGKNVVLSAFSVLTPVAQLSLASSGETHDLLLKTLGLPSDEAIKSVFPLVNAKLRDIKGVTLKQASRIYLPLTAELADDFAAASRDVFGSEAKNLDFTKNVESAKEINDWVEEQTNNRIQDLVDPDSIKPNTASLLVNAIYFKGTWKSKFDNASTTERDFHVSKDKTVKVPTMYQKASFKYGESAELDAKLLEMPYEGEKASFLIILPNDIEGLPALTEKLKEPQHLNKALSEMYKSEIQVYIPKFKIETETDLKEVMSNMGLSSLFEPGKATIDKLLKSKAPLYIGDAKQKAFIEVNEEGSEAAAANVFGIAYMSAVISEPLIFNVNHPFVFALMQKRTMLFNGVFQSL
nr:Serpin1 [Plutella xylostella]